MTIEERRDREKEEMRELIIRTAGDIIAAEGIEKLSIRKIANQMEYSPAIIYHYFKDKEDILNQLMSRGYQKIMSALVSADAASGDPEEKLKLLTKNYIETALKMPEEYKQVQLSGSPASLQFTSSMFQGASAKKPALKVLSQCLKEMYPNQDASDSTIELTAQLIAASTFGLIIKLIIEKDIDQEQQARLIDYYVEVMILNMASGSISKNKK
ncbi:TetR/AcrR family transcriptional regulator [Sinanaerobacter chloroacetimidivorans]|uniref:TetR/AcrR family transcriptional regulator n=1 Tax=Sinanaerobacter chloroacetimidivorans TaxID=2818044 RepID=A0A8J8B281_9FIRM|nr:TetR/AcrR family transcriptional regulator [Sinanaerobacter chloroacetimidivorans]MBR0596995.1 TetR/AcrR family transcriptional regulator [Sinanaerobacter chloroacetimidivorans]